MTESKFQSKVITYIKKVCPLTYLVKYDAYIRAGVPDLLMCINGRFVGIEIKVGKNKPTPLQKVSIVKINQAGGIGLIL